MGERVIIQSGDHTWAEAVKMALEDQGWQILTNSSVDPHVDTKIFNPTAFIFHADAPVADIKPTIRPAVLQGIVTAIRSDFISTPVLIITSVPSEKLTKLIELCGCGDLILDRVTNSDVLANNIVRSVAQLKPVRHPQGGSLSATVEIELHETYLDCEVRVGQLLENFGPLKWDRREANLLNEEFKHIEEHTKSFGITDGDRRFLSGTARRLLLHVFEEPLDRAEVLCRPHLSAGGIIFYRFTTQDGDLDFVPFELVATRNDGEFLRGVYPVARKLMAKQQHRDPSRTLRLKSKVNHVLFIMSNVTGDVGVEGETFKGDKIVSLNALSHLGSEFDRIHAEYGSRGVEIEPLKLRTGVDNIELLSSAMNNGPFAVVHFAGHSLRTDTGRVFLLLPGKVAGEIIPYDADTFARITADADARLVVLSSCEGASGSTLSRMASFGVPAVAGFRWPVVDGDAAEFTPAFHEALFRNGHFVPVAVAFREALLYLKDRGSNHLSWLSPALMLQSSALSEYSLEI